MNKKILATEKNSAKKNISVDKSFFTENKDDVIPFAILELNQVMLNDIFNSIKDCKKTDDDNKLKELLDKYLIPNEPLNILTNTKFVKLNDGRTIHSIKRNNKQNTENISNESADLNIISEINLSMKGTNINITKNFWNIPPDEELHKNKRCLYCGRIPKNPIGMPISEIINYFNSVIKFKCVGTYCWFHCMISKANLIENTNSILSKSRFLIRIMYNYYHPDKGELIPAPDPMLLICNGGSLPDEEFDGNQFEYILNTTNIKQINHVYEYSKKSNV